MPDTMITRGPKKTNAELLNLGNEPNHYRLESPNDFESFSNLLTERCGYPIEFLQQPSKFRDIEENLFIAPVAVLHNDKENSMSWGVFAKKDFIFRGDSCLGRYLGKTDRFSKRKDVDYMFDLDNGMALDGKHQRGWPAIVNGSSCRETANVAAEKINGGIYYYLCRTIKAGDQLLVYYGDEYTCEDQRCLNPSDNWQESSDKLKQHQSIYTTQESNDEAFLALFEFKNNKFAIPDSSISDTYVNPDIPILIYKNRRDLLPQSQQENITLLMLACWCGDPENISTLLSAGADPYKQTSIRSYSCLHLVAHSPHLNPQQKIAITDLIVNHAGSTLKLQDWHRETVLHLALKTKQIELVTHILMRDARISHYGKNKSVRDCFNEDKLSIFETAIVSFDIAMVSAVLPYWRTKDIDCFLKNTPTAFKKRLRECSSQKRSDYLKSVIQKIVESSIPDTHREMLITLLKQYVVTNQPDKKRKREKPGLFEENKKVRAKKEESAQNTNNDNASMCCLS